MSMLYRVSVCVCTQCVSVFVEIDSPKMLQGSTQVQQCDAHTGDVETRHAAKPGEDVIAPLGKQVYLKVVT